MSDKELVYRIIGSAMDVYRNLGHGLLESIYQEALEMELDQSGILCETEKEVQSFTKV